MAEVSADNISLFYNDNVELQQNTSNTITNIYTYTQDAAYLNLYFFDNASYTAEVINMKGAILYSRKIAGATGHSISTDCFSKGVYLLRLSSPTVFQVKRFMVR